MILARSMGDANDVADRGSATQGSAACTCGLRRRLMTQRRTRRTRPTEVCGATHDLTACARPLFRALEYCGGCLARVVSLSMCLYSECRVAVWRREIESRE